MPGSKAKPYQTYANIIAADTDSLAPQVRGQLLCVPQSGELLQDKSTLQLSVATHLAWQLAQQPAGTASPGQLFVAACQPGLGHVAQLQNSAAAWDGIGGLLGGGRDPGGDVAVDEKTSLARKSGARFDLALSCPEVPGARLAVMFAEVVRAQKVQPTNPLHITHMSIGQTTDAAAAATSGSTAEAGPSRAASVAKPVGDAALPGQAALQLPTLGGLVLEGVQQPSPASAPPVLPAMPLSQVGDDILNQFLEELNQQQHEDILFEEPSEAGAFTGSEHQHMQQLQQAAGQVRQEAGLARSSSSSVAAGGGGGKGLEITLTLRDPLRQSLGSRPKVALSGFGHKDFDKELKLYSISADGRTLKVKSQSQSLSQDAAARMAARVCGGEIQQVVTAWWDEAPAPDAVEGGPPVVSHLLHFEAQLEVVLTVGRKARKATADEAAALKRWLQEKLGPFMAGPAATLIASAQQVDAGPRQGGTTDQRIAALEERVVALQQQLAANHQVMHQVMEEMASMKRRLESLYPEHAVQQPTQTAPVQRLNSRQRQS
ncbi:hypothetical protein N2152v2_003875 [Parachlorella kessleri]